jgi:uncharacterized protein with HEPN domain
VSRTDVRRLEDVLAHRYFDASHGIVDHTVRHDLPELVDAVRRLLADPATH